jgi:hypothetical protein
MKLSKPWREGKPLFLQDESFFGEVESKGIGSIASQNLREDNLLPAALKELNKQGTVYVKGSGRGFNIFWKKDGVLFNVQSGSNNSKTGDMVQIGMFPLSWALAKTVLKGDSDKKVCFSCPHSQSKGGTCYVRKGFDTSRGMQSKISHISYERIPNYNSHTERIVLALCKGRPVRFGTYGEPILLGEELTSKISKVATSWTGYTHRWMIPAMQWAKKYFMASVENVTEMKAAVLAGWRVFYVNMDKNVTFVGTQYAPNVPKQDRLVVCPASAEFIKAKKEKYPDLAIQDRKEATCTTCKMCAGTTGTKVAASIVINKH